MIEILDSPKHLVAMRLSGKLTAEDVAAAYKATEEALKENDRISFFAEVDESMNLTFEGVFKDMLEGIWQIGKLKHYSRVALVTSKGWIAAIARVEGIVFSSVDVRVFDPAEHDKAFAWASEKPEPLPKPEDRGPAIHLIQTTNENVFAYEVDGPIGEKDIETAVRGLNDAFEGKEKINVLGRLKNWAGFDLVAVLSDQLFKTKYKSLSKVEKYAVVGAKPWMRNFLELINPAIGPTIRVFDTDEENAAWEWVGARQALLPE
ncbi:MAG: hypothetical protein DMF62_16615 [Acidobacteria bacterium]|nr:MAG: hypothetical protein DMF62_16615 [Acidobacteriota bacterium]